MPTPMTWDNPSKDNIDGLLDAVREASWAFESLEDATTLFQQASALTRLSNAMSDLASWHPDYSYRTGEIMDTLDGGV